MSWICVKILWETHRTQAILRMERQHKTNKKDNGTQGPMSPFLFLLVRFRWEFQSGRSN